MQLPDGKRKSCACRQVFIHICECSSVDDVHAKYGHDLHDEKRILVSDDLDFFAVYEKYNR